MITYDFLIKWFTSETVGDDEVTKYIVEKLPISHNPSMPILDEYLAKDGVSDTERGRIIEALEALPYGAHRIETSNNFGKLIIQQEA
jgi:hypothetical protein